MHMPEISNICCWNQKHFKSKDGKDQTKGIESFDDDGAGHQWVGGTFELWLARHHLSRTSFNLRGKNVAMMSIIKVVIVIMMIMRRCVTVELFYS